MINNENISDFKMKANYFNSFFFASHLNMLDNKSKVAGNQTYITDSTLFTST